MSDRNPYISPDSILSSESQTTYVPRLVSWHGRIGRVRFVAYGLSTLLVLIMAVSILGITSSILEHKNYYGINSDMVAGAAAWLAAFATIIYWIMLSKRRLNDLGKSGWYSALIFVPLVNIVLYVILMLLAGETTENRFGSPSAKNGKILIWGGLVFTSILVGMIILSLILNIFIKLNNKTVSKPQNISDYTLRERSR